MSESDSKKGRADAAKGDFDPPKRGPFDGTFDTKENWEHTSERRQDYREGYYDKKNEMKEDKKK